MAQLNSPSVRAPTSRPLPLRVWNTRRTGRNRSMLDGAARHAGSRLPRLTSSSSNSSMKTSRMSWSISSAPSTNPPSSTGVDGPAAVIADGTALAATDCSTANGSNASAAALSCAMKAAASASSLEAALERAPASAALAVAGPCPSAIASAEVIATLAGSSFAGSGEASSVTSWTDSAAGRASSAFTCHTGLKKLESSTSASGTEAGAMSSTRGDGTAALPSTGSTMTGSSGSGGTVSACQSSLWK